MHNLLNEIDSVNDKTFYILLSLSHVKQFTIIIYPEQHRSPRFSRPGECSRSGKLRFRNGIASPPRDAFRRKKKERGAKVSPRSPFGINVK